MLPDIYLFYQKEIFEAKKGDVVGQIRFCLITSKFYTVLLYIDSWNISHLHVPMSTLTIFRHPYCYMELNHSCFLICTFLSHAPWTITIGNMDA